MILEYNHLVRWKESYLIKPRYIDCPFKQGPFSNEWAGTIVRTKGHCSVNHKNCTLDAKEGLDKCRIVQALDRALREKDWPVIEHLRSKDTGTMPDFDEFCYLLTQKPKDGIHSLSRLRSSYMSWRKEFLVELGRWLMEECRKDRSCPAKALLPEYDISSVNRS